MGLVVPLLFLLQAVAVERAHCIFCVPPLKISENANYGKTIFRMNSDYDFENVSYSLEGKGANQDPLNVFVVDPNTGHGYLTKVLDREKIDFYNLTVVVRFINGTIAEKFDFAIWIRDENDNTPVFGEIEPAEVDELSPAGTFIMKVTATDADEPLNINSEIAYSITEQNPPHDMFYMKRDGTIYVKKPSLDREKCDQYILTVRGQDLNGAPDGNSGTGTVTIKIRDVNDNPPTLEQEQFEGSIEENTHGVEVMRMKAEDLDLKGTNNWEAVFDIVKGNEAGYFSFRTESNTNEGILMLDKPVDYEDVKNLKLRLIVRNKALPFVVSGMNETDLHSGGRVNDVATVSCSDDSSWQGGTAVKIYTIKISVKNQHEGPRFDPKVKAIPISEGTTSFNINDVIASYPAIDEDTGKLAENVRYDKESDLENWLTIDPETAEIKLNRKPDWKSPHLVNGTYITKILGITEALPAKTVTGTIAVQVQDFNDNCPILASGIQAMCTTADNVIVNAEDKDVYPNGPPFKFEIIPEATEGRWQVEHLNDTATILRAQESMWLGIYKIELVIKDQQGRTCPEPQKARVQICTCEDGVMCGKQGDNGQLVKGARLGPAGIGTLVQGLILLLIVPLLLLHCRCKRTAADLAPTENLLTMALESDTPATAGGKKCCVKKICCLNLRPETKEEMEFVIV